MLQAIRTRAGGIVVKTLFALLILSFGYWGIYTRSPFYQDRSPESVIATVGDESIRAEDLQRVLQPTLERLRQQFGGTIDPQQVKQLGILDSLLAQLVNRDLLDQEIQRLRLDVSDEVIRSAIYDNPTFKTPDGQFDRALFQQMLAMNRMTEDELISRLRREVPRGDLVQAITAGIAAPRPVVETLYRYRGEKRLADIVALPAAAAPNPGQPSEDQLARFYDSHQQDFRAPEYRGFTVATLAPEDLVRPGTIPEERLRREYEQRKDEFATPEQRDVQQILAPTEDKAKQAAAALAAGQDWKEVAKSLGQNPDTVDLGLLTEKDLPAPLGEAAFDLPLNEASQPIKSPPGWHILRVVKITPSVAQSFEQVKPQLEKEMELDEAAGRLDKIGNQVDDALAGGAQLADVASKYGLKLTLVASVDPAGNDAAGKPVELPLAPQDILKTAFATEQNQTSRVANTQSDAIYVVHLDKIVASQVKPLSEVKDQAVAEWQKEQQSAEVGKQAQDLAASVKPDQPLAKAAAEKRLTATPSPPLGRTAEAAHGVSPNLLAKLFAAKQGEVVTASDPSGAYVAQLKEIQVPENPSDEALSGLSQEVSGEERRDVAEEFTESLKQRYPVEIKRDQLDRMF